MLIFFTLRGIFQTADVWLSEDTKIVLLGSKYGKTNLSLATSSKF